MSTKMTVVALVAVVIIAIGGYMFPKMTTGGLFGSTSCSIINCLSGGLRLVSDAGGAFESDVAASFATTVGVTGAATLSSTLAVTATSTLSDTVSLNNSGICINFFATSSQTRTHLTASTTGTIPNGAAGIMTFDYGACAL